MARKVRDKALLRLISKYLRAGALVGESLQPTATGVPQGSPLSPLLSNVRLDDLDKELERRGHRFARYCDDFLLVVKSQRAGERVKASLTMRARVRSDPPTSARSWALRFTARAFIGPTKRSRTFATACAS